jgi:hypothetical protein
LSWAAITEGLREEVLRPGRVLEIHDSVGGGELTKTRQVNGHESQKDERNPPGETETVTGMKTQTE